MNVIVAGCGRVGSQLAMLLANDGHNVSVIDKNQEAFERLGSTFNGVTVKGLAFDEDVLRSANIEGCDVFAAVTNFDNTNLMAAEVAGKIFGIEHTVARLYNPDREATYEQLGIEYVCGTSLVAETINDMIHAGHSHFVDLYGDVEIQFFPIADDLVGQRVHSIAVDGKLLPAIIRRGEMTFIPTTESVFETGDVLRVAVKTDYLPKIERYMKKGDA